MSLTEPRTHYKPFDYPWAYEGWKQQQQVHWLPEEVPLGDDVKDWQYKLTDPEKSLLSQIFRFFTQSDVEVANNYNTRLLQVFPPPELQMMLTSFANMETIHQAAYSHLLDTIGMSETEYSVFLQYKEMKDKYDYMQKFDVNNPENIALNLAVFGGFTEGVQLFASFAILLNFPRFNKMRGMGQIIAWSVRDESLHCEYITRLFRTFVEENRSIWTDSLKKRIYDSCRTIIEHEDAFIDLAFSGGGVEGLTAGEVKQYIRYIADRRLIQLGLRPNYDVKHNPLPWIDEMLNGVELANFFETRPTEYSKGGLEGEWDDVYEDPFVEIKGQPNCEWCDKAVGLLMEHNIPHSYVSLNPDQKVEEYAKTGASTTPVVYVSGKFIGGYQDLEEQLKALGY